MNTLANLEELNVDFLRDLKIARDLTRNALFEEACEKFRVIRIPVTFVDGAPETPPLVRREEADAARLRCEALPQEGAQKSIQAFKAVRVP